MSEISVDVIDNLTDTAGSISRGVSPDVKAGELLKPGSPVTGIGHRIEVAEDVDADSEAFGMKSLKGGHVIFNSCFQSFSVSVAT